MTTVQRQCAAPATAVWEVLADPWLYASWVVGASRIRAVEGRWPWDGALIHHSVGLWPVLLNDSTSVVSSAPPRELVLQARGRPLGEARVVMRLADAPNGCTITMEEDAVSGPGKLLPGPVQDVVIGGRNREALRRLALIAEGRHHGVSPDQDPGASSA